MKYLEWPQCSIEKKSKGCQNVFYNDLQGFSDLQLNQPGHGEVKDVMTGVQRNTTANIFFSICFCSPLVAGQILERIATEFNQLQFHAVQSKGMPLLDKVRPVSTPLKILAFLAYLSKSSVDQFPAIIQMDSLQHYSEINIGSQF